jgi:hypothetical protein
MAKLLVISDFLVGAVHATSETQLFRVVYKVKYSIASGNMTLTVSKNDKGGFDIDSKSMAVGAAKLIAGDPVQEHAEFEIQDGIVRSMSYQLDGGSDKAEENIQITYDWDAGTAIMNSEKGEESKALDEDTMDQLVMQAAAILNIINGVEQFTLKGLQPEKDHQVITYTRMGEEKLKTKLGELNTIKYSRKRGGSTRENHFWYSIDHNYVPVQIEQVKGSKSVWKASLDKLEQ